MTYFFYCCIILCFTLSALFLFTRMHSNIHCQYWQSCSYHSKIPNTQQWAVKEKRLFCKKKTERGHGRILGVIDFSALFASAMSVMVRIGNYVAIFTTGLSVRTYTYTYVGARLWFYSVLCLQRVVLKLFSLL